MLKVVKYFKIHSQLIMFLVLSISIIPFVLISFYSRPCSDDYNYSINMIRMVETGNSNVFTVIKTGIETDVEFYNTWNGLYISGFLQAMQPGAYLGEQNYYVGTIVLMLLMFFGIYYFVKTLFEIFGVNFNVLLSSLILFSFFIHGMISTVQGLYWFCGAYDYIPFLILTMVNVAWY